MGKADLIVRGGRVVLPNGILTADVAVTDGRIAAVSAERGLLDGRRVIDVDGLHVLPGEIGRASCRERV